MVCNLVQYLLLQGKECKGAVSGQHYLYQSIVWTQYSGRSQPPLRRIPRVQKKSKSQIPNTQETILWPLNARGVHILLAKDLKTSPAAKWCLQLKELYIPCFPPDLTSCIDRRCCMPSKYHAHVLFQFIMILAGRQMVPSVTILTGMQQHLSMPDVWLRGLYIPLSSNKSNSHATSVDWQ